MTLTLAEYARQAAQTAIYPKPFPYLSLGLLGEVGEVAGKLAKQERDGTDLREEILDELGDVLWMLVMREVELSDGREVLWEMPEPIAGHPLELLRRLASGSASLGLWHGLVVQLGGDWETVAQRNLEKLRGRQRRGTLSGSGDKR